jgi:hypothetical protein
MPFALCSDLLLAYAGSMGTFEPRSALLPPSARRCSGPNRRHGVPIGAVTHCDLATVTPHFNGGHATKSARDIVPMYV